MPTSRQIHLSTNNNNKPRKKSTDAAKTNHTPNKHTKLQTCCSNQLIFCDQKTKQTNKTASVPFGPSVWSSTHGLET